MIEIYEGWIRNEEEVVKGIKGRRKMLKLEEEVVVEGFERE
ncbi:hypothetical protein [Bacillus subtilis]|nr:hypothetical protein [Bacillus subtilis]